MSVRCCMKAKEMNGIPSLMSSRLPSRWFSDIAIAMFLASGVAKSTYANLMVPEHYGCEKNEYEEIGTNPRFSFTAPRPPGPPLAIFIGMCTLVISPAPSKN